MNSFVFLLLAITTEVLATSALRASEGLTKLLPTGIMVVGYAASFYFLGHALKEIPVGTAYAVWSGLGTIGIVVVGILAFQEKLDILHVIGIALIVAGVVILNTLGRGATA